MSNAEVPISKATIVLTLIKHVAATGGLDVIWGAQKACAVAGLPMRWDVPFIHRTTAFASKEELVKITGVTVSGMANQAKEEMADNMVVALNNLTNAAVEKNGTIKTLVKATLALTKAVDSHNTSLLTLTPTLTKLSNQCYKGDNNSGDGGGGSSSGGPAVDPAVFNPTGYYWSYG
jgi:hypothetical protein